MKKSLITAICIIAVLSLLIALSCGKKKNPSSPSSTNTPGPTFSYTITPTFTTTPTPIQVSDFEGNSLESWTAGCCTFTASPVTGTTNGVAPYMGNGMVELAFALSSTAGLSTGTATAIFQNDVSNYNPLPNFQNKTIIVHVWIPDELTTTTEAYTLQVFFIGGGTNQVWHREWIYLANFSKSQPTYVDDPVTETVLPDAWNTLWYAIDPSDAGYVDAAAVDSYGIQLMQNSGDTVSGTIYVDNIKVE